MSIELRITPRRQTTPNSCWWTSIAVVLDYYGQHYSLPGQFRPEFRRPAEARWNALAPVETPSIDQAMQQDPTLRSFRGQGDSPHSVPWTWYDFGLPNSDWGLRRVSEITGFQGVPDCPAYGLWSVADVEHTLRHHGPFVFFGLWNGFPHAIVVAGARQGRGQVDFMDPAQGFVLEEPISTFNNRMRGMTIGVRAIVQPDLLSAIEPVAGHTSAGSDRVAYRTVRPAADQSEDINTLRSLTWKCGGKRWRMVLEQGAPSYKKWGRFNRRRLFLACGGRPRGSGVTRCRSTLAIC
jgi:hypothetical protein